MKTCAPLGTPVVRITHLTVGLAKRVAINGCHISGPLLQPIGIGHLRRGHIKRAFIAISCKFKQAMYTARTLSPRDGGPMVTGPEGLWRHTGAIFNEAQSICRTK